MNDIHWCLFRCRDLRYAYIPCEYVFYGKSMHRLFPIEEKSYIDLGYKLVVVGHILVTEKLSEVTCSKCKESWEYIEACIEKDTTL